MCYFLEISHLNLRNFSRISIILSSADIKSFIYWLVRRRQTSLSFPPMKVVASRNEAKNPRVDFRLKKRLGQCFSCTIRSVSLVNKFRSINELLKSGRHRLMSFCFCSSLIIFEQLMMMIDQWTYCLFVPSSCQEFNKVYLIDKNCTVLLRSEG